MAFILSYMIFIQVSQVSSTRPERAEAFKCQAIYKAFALTGRIVDCHYTQGDALG